jgi:hypothetical protein
MKNLQLKWNPKKVRLMEETRGGVTGVVAVLASAKLGGGHSAIVSGASLDELLDRLPPSVCVYAVMPSCDPAKVAQTVNEMWWCDAEFSAPPYTVESDGIKFHNIVPDTTLHDVRAEAFNLFAEQHRAEIVAAFGRAAATP